MISPDVLPNEPTSTSEESSTSKKTIRILLVEDHCDTRTTLAFLLRHFGFEIVVADRLATALDACSAQLFDVVLADIGLPDGSGYDLISQAKRQQAVTAIALTGFGQDEDLRRSKEAGFDFHLTKPVDFHELRTILGRIGS
jgi:DNA-binding response OmpR family regulator